MQMRETSAGSALDALFHADTRTVRYGATENLYGNDEIAAFRRAGCASSRVGALLRATSASLMSRSWHEGPTRWQAHARRPLHPTTTTGSWRSATGGSRLPADQRPRREHLIGVPPVPSLHRLIDTVQ